MGEPPSSSDAVDEQVRVLVTYTDESGLMDTEETTGSVFAITTVSDPVSDVSAVSVAVTVHTSVSPGETNVGVRVRLADVPNTSAVSALVQLKVFVMLSPSGSLTEAPQCTAVVVVTSDKGEILTLHTMGA